ncbi:MAG: hypothetical protein HZT41_12060 [Dechloromonas sp.]|nr:MAG: hypothetical protein HZT41_12060 [Dechloromonas sp.]
MNNRALVAALVVPLLLAACSIGYEARGSLGDVPGEMRGKGYPGSSGGGRFLLADREGRLTCDGQALPPSLSPNPGSCAGESGTGVVRCSDGREIPLRWEAITCRSWKGSGVDANGNRLEFRVERR